MSVERFESLMRLFVERPEKWDKLPLETTDGKPSKSHIARSYGITVETIEEQIAKARAEAPKQSSLKELKYADVPDDCFPPGFLTDVRQKYFGDMCNAFAWPAILSAASMHVMPLPQEQKQQTNLFCAIVGDSGDGKTIPPQRASQLFRLKELGRYKTAAFGSAEGMMDDIGNLNGLPVLWNPDELSHPMGKASIKGASFKSHLMRLFGESTYSLRNRDKKSVIDFNAFLSVIGGAVTDNFYEVFDASTLFGLWQRFFFFHTPTGYKLRYSPCDEPPIDIPGWTFPTGDQVTIDQCFAFRVPKTTAEVWHKKIALENDGCEGRILEIVMRMARIFYACDRKLEIRASDMEPFWKLADYQTKMRVSLRPNAGLTTSGQADEEIRRLLDRLEPGTEGNWREMKKNSRPLMKLGGVIADQSLWVMEKTGEVIVREKGSPKGGRRSKFIRKRTANDKDE